MAEEPVRRGLLIRTVLEILRDRGAKIPQAEVYEELRRRVQLTPYELSMDNSGLPRYDRAVGFHSGDAATIGWMSKIGGWSITEAGSEALDTYEEPDRLWAELSRQWNDVNRRRKEAQRNLSEVQQFIADAIALVEPGSWTSHEDLGELAGRPGSEVADFLAAVRVANSYRVLDADGSVPPEGQLHFTYRGGTSLRDRLAHEGVSFDSNGRASQSQQLTAGDLKELLRTRAEETREEEAPAAKRAWMVRGSSVDGFNLVPEWLKDGFVSLSASQLAKVDPDASYDELRRAVDEGYEHKSYAYREQRLAEFDRFLRRMRPGDLALTTTQGEVFIGEVTGQSAFTDSEHGLSNLRRDVHWHNADKALPADRLAPPVPALLQDQAYVVDLTEAYEQLAALTAPVAPPPRRELAFRTVTGEFAYEVYLDRTELAKIVDLLWDRKQIILYGPPGTGKTWLAKKLARHLTSDMDGAVRLVQFHPSYTYEDFFEGFRPKAASGSLSFELRPGPFRDFAETAEADTSTPYILVIDEINRANLAKVFGELYFLLEYRDESIRLQYSPDKPFRLPPNLFIIGTMNTADRSIAKVDSAMRRRFAFIELHPRTPPVQGLLSRWLVRKGLPDWPAHVLDELNSRIEDADAAIGPSYLMDPRIYQRDDGVERVWQYWIMPLLADQFYGQTDLEERYGLAALRRAVGADTEGQPSQPQEGEHGLAPEDQRDA